MRPVLRLAVVVTITAALASALLPSSTNALGIAATLAVSGDSATICGVAAGAAPLAVFCSLLSPAGNSTSLVPLLPNVSFDSVAGGRDFLCGLRSGGRSFFCWPSGPGGTLMPQRVYKGPEPLSDLTVGEDQVAAVEGAGAGVQWWRGHGGGYPPNVAGSYFSLTSGNGFTCGISSNGTVNCWGRSGAGIQTAFAGLSMASLVAGDAHACGLDNGGRLLCGGRNDSGQANPPPASSAFEFSSLALGVSHTCALRRPNSTVVCWGSGGGGGRVYFPVETTSFEFIVAGGNLTCGVTVENLTVLCWGTNRGNPAAIPLPLPRILPGICMANQSSCACGLSTDSGSLCSGSGVICQPCSNTRAASPPSPAPQPPPPPPPLPPSRSRKPSKAMLAFAIVGSVGVFAGVCSIVYCLVFGVCRHKKVHNSVQPTITGGPNAAPSAAAGGGAPAFTSPFTSPSGSRSRIFRRQGSRVFRRQRSGPSSFKDRAEEFTFAELAAATKNFSLENKIGAGSFGTVYKGKLADGREVAIKRSESGPRTKKFQEKESAFQSELAFLSRLHHKHLVGFVGYCEEREERLLVYEYMKNGALYDHLHSKANGNASSSVLSSWKMRIKVLLDAARGIEYLHSYAVPPIIHRDIKSSNILLDANWVAKVSDFGLSLMGPETEGGHLSMRAAGTVGYMDPEYYGLHHLTAKSDVYGLGVVMLEVLTGKRAIFKSEEGPDGGGGSPVSVVDFAMPSLVAGEVGRVLDPRVGPPGTPGEAEAVELVAYTAKHCVSLEGRDRPSMGDIVANLESALALCEDSHGSISSTGISIASAD